MKKINMHTLYKTIDGEVKEMRVNDDSLEHGQALGWETAEAKAAKEAVVKAEIKAKPKKAA